MSFSYGQDQLTAGKALAIARRELTTTISSDTNARVEASNATVLRVAAGERAAYGINTGFGPLCNERINPEETVAL